jgi:uncharacterized protein YndB with AHSA1/START domain
MFTDNELLASWLTNLADVEPHVGGKYELFWVPDEREYNSTIGCKITAMEPNKLLSFEWKGPKTFKDFMNTANPLTHVVVMFVGCVEGAGSCTEVHLIHTGWHQGDNWEEARLYFEKAWVKVFENLKQLVEKRASS